MKNLALENYGVDTLSFDEMLCIDGGGWLGGLIGLVVGFVASGGNPFVAAACAVIGSTVEDLM